MTPKQPCRTPNGRIRDAQLSSRPPPFVRPRRKTGRKRQGLEYEKKGHREFDQRYGGFYVPSPWFTYRRGDHIQPSWCQPDALLFDVRRNLLIVIEFKYQHTSDAYWQVMDLYIPVLESWLAEAPVPWDIRPLEVVKWYDPQTHFPVDPVLCPEPSRVPQGAFGVHIWNPKRGRANADAPPPTLRPSQRLKGV